jgi:hypothetical protein
MSGFIYVEPFEVRKEIILRPKDLQRWLDLDLQGRQDIPVDIQGQLKEKVARFVSEHFPVHIDGTPVKGELESVNFLERTLTSSRVIDPPQPLNTNAAIMGVIMVYPRNGVLPQQVTMDWDLWDTRIQQVPVSAVDQAGPLPSYLEPDWKQLTWQNFLKNPEIPKFRSIHTPAQPWQIALFNSRFIFIALLMITTIWLGYRAKQRQGLFLPATVGSVLILGCGASFGLGASNKPHQETAEAIIAGLLHNIYRAFDYREESDIYDVLERSVAGELLTDIYLETKRSLVLKNQGGARAKVKSVQLESVALDFADQGKQLVAEASWVVKGSVGHWGHVHQRNNRYQAKLGLEIVDDQWKLGEMTVLHEERL